MFNIEKQAGKRVQKYLMHQSTQENIEPANARLVINSNAETISVHFHDQHRFIKTLSIRNIVEFFGQEYDETKVDTLYEYLKKLSQENSIGLSNINIVICETKGEPGAHLYNESKYVKRLSTIELLTAVY